MIPSVIRYTDSQTVLISSTICLMVSVRCRGSGSSMGGISERNGSAASAAMPAGSTDADLLENLKYLRSGECRLAGGQLINHHAEREYVAGESGRLAASLLGGQVAGRTEHSLARLGHAQFVRILQN